MDSIDFDPDTQINVWMFGRKTWEKRFRDVGRELIKMAVFVNGFRTTDELPGVGLSFSIDNPRAVDWIKRRVYDFAYRVNETTERELRAALVDAINAGSSIGDIKKEVQRIFGYAEGYRNERIARTETISATNYGAWEAMKQSGIVGIKKEWIATIDERTRESHSDLDGEITGLDDTFSNGLQFPGDPHGEAAEVINCRCTIVHIFPDEEE